MLDKIYSILELVLGRSRQGSYTKDELQYQFNCPWCAEDNDGEPDGKFNLEVNLGLGKFHCWKCDSKGKISYLIKKWGDRRYLDDYYALVKEMRDSRLYDITLFQGIEGDSILEDDGDVLTLPATYRKIDLNTCRKAKLLEFLKRRSIGPDLIEKYNMGYTTFDEEDFRMRDRLIIPSYDSSGNLNYWVGRDFSGYRNAVSYRNSSNDKKKIVFKESLINWDATIYLCEGLLDCIRYTNIIPLLGKFLTRDSEIYRQLYSRANGKIVICLDGDTKIEETKRIYNLLNVGRLRGRIRYLRLGSEGIPEKDFSEIYEKYGPAGMVGAFRQERDFREIELLI